jgi:SAM-dependent methyltransferase
METIKQFLRQWLPDWLRPAVRLVRRMQFYVRRFIRGETITTYELRVAAEKLTFDEQTHVHDLPQVAHYWADKYVRPMLEEFGCSNPDQFFLHSLQEAARRTQNKHPIFLSVGADNCDTEVRLSVALKNAGMQDFTFECLELNPIMLARGAQDAEKSGVAVNMQFTETDFNTWQPSKKYDGVIANQALHHVLDLEHLFDAIKNALQPMGLFVTSDVIGRNGHMRWPEAFAAVQRFWQELPDSYRYNAQLRRLEKRYRNWDCSSEGFEGIRAQDVLPELLKRFHFKSFIPFANVADIFVDRSFGPHFDPSKEWDRNFIDRVHAFDEKSFQDGTLTPTHLIASMTLSDEGGQFSRGTRPEKCVRAPIPKNFLAKLFSRH